jgi:hypothetical protein
MKGKTDAFGSFRDVLAGEMARGLPELKEDVKMVVESTGGTWEESKRGDDVVMGDANGVGNRK